MMLLASRLGRTLGELGATMSGEEFGLWEAAYALEHGAHDKHGDGDEGLDDFERFRKMAGG